ncbi:hypothetical protein Q5M85_03995 [Paraclostridium bifermentans]|nr:hypothetical protein [Paraclostridium bifermentans]
MIIAAIAGSLGLELELYLNYQKKGTINYGSSISWNRYINNTRQVGLMPAGGDAMSLSGSKLVIGGIVGNFILGALKTQQVCDYMHYVWQWLHYLG